MMGYVYENAAGDRISALIDMINGGGPGRSGDTFEGGGILSLLANAVAKPYGSVRERPGHTPMGATAAPMGVAPVAVPGDATPPPVTTTTLDDVGEETGRPFTEADIDALRLAPPQLAQRFNGVPVGAPLTPREEKILNSLRAFAATRPGRVMVEAQDASAAGPDQPQVFFEPQGLPDRPSSPDQPLVTPELSERARYPTVTPPFRPMYPRWYEDTTYRLP